MVEGATEYVVSPTEVGTADPEEAKVPLSEIIDGLNDRFGTEFTETDRLLSSRSRRAPSKTRQFARQLWQIRSTTSSS